MQTEALAVATLDELLRRASAELKNSKEFRRHVKEGERAIREAMREAYGARMPGAIDYFKGPDGVWRMP